MIHIGDKPIKARYIGSRKVTAVYQGNTKVWGADAEPGEYVTRTVTWDGQPTDVSVVSTFEGDTITYYKISDLTPSYPECQPPLMIGAVSTSTGEPVTFTIDAGNMPPGTSLRREAGKYNELMITFYNGSRLAAAISVLSAGEVPVMYLPANDLDVSANFTETGVYMPDVFRVMYAPPYTISWQEPAAKASALSLHLTSDLAVKLYLTSGTAGGLTIDWGDGSAAETPQDTTVQASHTYAQAGDYTVTITPQAGVTWSPGASVTSGSRTTNYNVMGVDPNKGENNATLAAARLGGGVEALQEGAFQGCTGLASAYLPDGLASIGASAFSSCYALASVTIPGSVITIGFSAFSSCTALRSVTISGGVKTISSRSFVDCKSLKSIVIPDSVTSIGSQAFYVCGLESVKIGNRVATVDFQAFYGCTSLRSIAIPDSVTTVGNNAFGGCTALETMEVGSGTAGISADTVPNCTALKNINVAAGNMALSSLDGVLFDYEKKKLLVYPRGREDASYEIPSGVEAIDNSAFGGCSSLKSITIPNSVTTLGTWAFSACGSLENVVIPASVTTIGSSAFANCTSLESVLIPSSVTAVNNASFMGCTGLKTAEVAAAGFGINYFSGCTSLERVWIRSSCATITANSTSNMPFARCPASCQIYAEAGSKPSGWGTYYNYYSSSGTLQVTFGQTTRPW